MAELSIWDQMQKVFDLLPGPEPRAHQLRAGIGAIPLMPKALDARKIEQPLGIDQFAGIPILIDHLLPAFAWKLVDQYGDTMLSGELTVELDL